MCMKVWPCCWLGAPPYFVTNNNTMTAVLNDCYILIADHRFNPVKELVHILEGVAQSGKSLLIIAEDIDGEALAALIVNKMRGTLKVCAVKAPDFGERRKLILEDIAILTGGKVFDKEKGMKLDRFDFGWLGHAKTVTVTKEKTTVIDGNGTAEAITARAEELQAQIEKAQTPFEVEKLQERLSKFVGGVALVHVGGSTETEMKEKKDRVDDALHATQCALEDGIVPGGGSAFKIGDRLFEEDYDPVVEDYDRKEFEKYWEKYVKQHSKADDVDRKWIYGDGIKAVMPFNQRGKEVIKNWEQAKQAAINVSKHLS